MTTPAPATPASPVRPAAQPADALWRALRGLAVHIDPRDAIADDPGAIINVALTIGNLDPADAKAIHAWASTRQSGS